MKIHSGKISTNNTIYSGVCCDRFYVCWCYFSFQVSLGPGLYEPSARGRDIHVLYRIQEKAQSLLKSEHMELTIFFLFLILPELFATVENFFSPYSPILRPENHKFSHIRPTFTK